IIRRKDQLSKSRDQRHRKDQCKQCMYPSLQTHRDHPFTSTDSLAGSCTSKVRPSEKTTLTGRVFPTVSRILICSCSHVASHPLMPNACFLSISTYISPNVALTMAAEAAADPQPQSKKI